MPSYILRNISPELWATFKQRAQRDGHPMRWLILTLVQHYVAHGLPTTDR